MDIRKARNLRHVRRFNFHHCNKYQSVAEHSFFVALYAYELSKDLGVMFPATTSIIALMHDIEEAVTGDIGYLVKREIKDFNKIENKASKELGVGHPDYVGALDRAIVEFADCFELKLYLEEERLSGNISLFEIEQETWRRLLDIEIGDKDIKERWLKKLETIKPKKLPDSITHKIEGKHE